MDRNELDSNKSTNRNTMAPQNNNNNPRSNNSIASRADNFAQARRTFIPNQVNRAPVRKEPLPRFKPIDNSVDLLDKYRIKSTANLPPALYPIKSTFSTQNSFFRAFSGDQQSNTSAEQAPPPVNAPNQNSGSFFRKFTDDNEIENLAKLRDESETADQPPKLRRENSAPSFIKLTLETLDEKKDDKDTDSQPVTSKDEPAEKDKPAEKDEPEEDDDPLAKYRIKTPKPVEDDKNKRTSRAASFFKEFNNLSGQSNIILLDPAVSKGATTTNPSVGSNDESQKKPVQQGSFFRKFTDDSDVESLIKQQEILLKLGPRPADKRLKRESSTPSIRELAILPKVPTKKLRRKRSKIVKRRKGSKIEKKNPKENENDKKQDKKSRESEKEKEKEKSKQKDNEKNIKPKDPKKKETEKKGKNVKEDKQSDLKKVNENNKKKSEKTREEKSDRSSNKSKDEDSASRKEKNKSKPFSRPRNSTLPSNSKLHYSPSKPEEPSSPVSNRKPNNKPSSRDKRTVTLPKSDDKNHKKKETDQVKNDKSSPVLSKKKSSGTASNALSKLKGSNQDEEPKNRGTVISDSVVTKGTKSESTNPKKKLGSSSIDKSSSISQTRETKIGDGPSLQRKTSNVKFVVPAPEPTPNLKKEQGKLKKEQLKLKRATKALRKEKTLIQQKAAELEEMAELIRYSEEKAEKEKPKTVAGSVDYNEAWQLDWKEIQLDSHTLGAGTFAQVRKGTYCGTPIAAKRIPAPTDEDLEKYIDREISALRAMRHPNIVTFIGLAKRDDSQVLYLITELVELGDLHDLLEKKDKELGWGLRAQMMSDVCKGLRYLHGKNIVHRDIKSRNLLVTAGYRIKIADFGFAIQMDAGAAQRRTVCGTENWAAPEVMMERPYDSKADVFSLGVVIWEIITRVDGRRFQRLPLMHFAISEAQLAPWVPDDVPPEFVALARDCCRFSPDERPTMDSIMERLEQIEQAYGMAKDGSDAHDSSDADSGSSGRIGEDLLERLPHAGIKQKLKAVLGLENDEENNELNNEILVEKLILLAEKLMEDNAALTTQVEDLKSRLEKQ